jgi:hypothetical protein
VEPATKDGLTKASVKVDRRPSSSSSLAKKAAFSRASAWSGVGIGAFRIQVLLVLLCQPTELAAPLARKGSLWGRSVPPPFASPSPFGKHRAKSPRDDPPRPKRVRRASRSAQCEDSSQLAGREARSEWPNCRPQIAPRFRPAALAGRVAPRITPALSGAGRVAPIVLLERRIDKILGRFKELIQ